jgi:putative tryptophan/tyrosine transport system substrate-binding protein
MVICIHRREFIVTFGGMAAAWPLASYAQQPERMRRIGVLNVFAETDEEVQSWDAAFRKRLDELGWSMVATSMWTIAGAPAASSARRCSRRNWSV